MIDLSSISSQLMNPMSHDAPGSLGGGKALGNAASSGPLATTGNDSSGPSADGFIQVLEMFLGGSPLPSSLLGSTTITQTPTGSGLSNLAAAPDADEQAQATDLDTATSEKIASLLQMLGFQVKPDEIQNLSPLDREQLGSAMEFVQRNLERGADPGKVAENAALLLPRPWALDDADGSPIGTGDTTQSSTENVKLLPSDMIANLKDIRAKIQASLGQGQADNANQKMSGDANTADSIQNLAQGGRSSSSNGNDQFSSTSGQSQKSQAIDAAKKAASAEGSQSWAQQLQQAAAQAKSEESPTTTNIPRHLTPGGTSSELIGRQVLEKVHLQLTEGHRELKLRLWPEELGEVRLSLKMTDSEKVHANMVVENDAVRQAMLDATPQLKEALARHGLDLERLSVSVNQKDAQEPGTGSQARKDKREGSSKGGDNRDWNETEILVPEDITFGEDTGIRNGHNTIDLWS